jgi:integrase
MLRALEEDGRLDILRAIRDGHVSFLEVYDAYRRRALHELPVGDAMPLLDAAFSRWIKSSESEYSTKHINNLNTARRRFAKEASKARVADLPKVLDDLRASFGAKHPRSFNLARAAALAFVRATLKRSHPIWLACAAVEPRKVPARQLGQALSPMEFVDLFKKPEDDRIDAIAWSLATTGMGSKEYWGRWQTQSDRIHIVGTKRSGRVRDIPLVRAPSTPKLSRDRFEKLFRERFESITPYDLRRTYARWLELAGIPRTRRRLYMGHGVRDVTDLYERSEVAAFLVEDAARLRAFLGDNFVGSSPVTSPVALAK